MKITNHAPGAGGVPPQEPSLELKQGDVVQATVKQKTSGQDAVVTVRGQEMQVRFEGAMPPAGEKVHMTVTKTDGDIVQVKWSADAGGRSMPAAAGATGSDQVSDHYSVEQQRVSRLLADKGIVVAKAELEQVMEFLKSSQGTVAQKMETIQSVFGKGLELHVSTLKPVHEALHGEALSKQLAKLAGEVQPSRPSGGTAGQSTITVEPSESGKTDAAIVSDRIVAAVDRIKSEPVFQRMLQQLQQLYQSEMKNLPPELAGRLKKALAEAGSLQQAGRETAARSLLVATFGQVASSQQAAEPANAQPVSQEPVSVSATEPSLTKLLQQLRQWLQSAMQDQPELAVKLEKVLTEASLLQQAGREKAARSLLVATFGQVASSQQAAEPANTQPVPQGTASAPEPESSLAKLQHPLRQWLQSETSNLPEPAVAPGKSLSEANSFQPSGRESSAAEPSLSFMPSANPAKETASSAILPQQLADIAPEFAAWAQMSADEATKTVIVTHITPKLKQAAEEFKSLKRDITRNLDMIQQVVQANPKNALPQVKALLEASIHTLDKAILKSETMMLTDMGTEKQLMKASSQLAEAKKLLADGRHSSALKILNEVKAQLEQLNWKPADVKIRHLLLKQQTAEQPVSVHHRLAAEAENMTRPLAQQAASSREMFEAIRRIGLNHDSETAMSLAGQGQSSDKQENMKSLLLKLVQESASQPSSRMAEQALNHITGQQLLNRAEANSQQQSMYFSLPVPLDGRTEEVKVTINARKEGQRVDWENCTLFFMIDTPKMGPTGIHVSIAERNLSVTIKNDSPEIDRKTTEVAKTYIPRLQEIGYRVSGVKSARLEAPESAKSVPDMNPLKQTAASPNQPNPIRKGFDFKV